MTAAAESPTHGFEDSPMTWPVEDSRPMYEGPIITVRRDALADADGSAFERDVVEHKGSVGIVALDDEDRVLLISQYRHSARQRLVELPAGLLDRTAEDPEQAARRELAEEGWVRAERWSLLLELMPSPGVSDEVITLYLAEGISPVDVPEGFVAQHEESTMTRGWVALSEVVDAVLARRVKNAALAAGVLAAWVRRHPPIS